MGTFGDSWLLTKCAFRTIREDKALLVFPLVSGLAAVAILVMFVVGLFSLSFWSGLSASNFQLVVGVLAIVVYFLLWIVSIFFTGALIGAAMMKLNGGQPKFSDGIAAARGRIGRLIVWALIAGTVMILIRAISQRIRGLPGMIVGVAAGVAWGVMTYFVVPVLMFEQETAWGSLKRSANLYLHHFGRTFVSNIALGLLLALGFVAAIVLGIVGAYLLFSGLVLVGVIVILAALVLFVFMMILSAAAEGVLVTALYRYATTGQVVPGLIPQRLVGTVQGSGSGSTVGAPLRSY